jgi:hypothetical protein
MTRQLRALVLVVALGSVAFIASTLTALNDSRGPDPRPVPALADGLPSDVAAARRQFADRVRQRFPLGSPERALMLELWSEGFERPGDAGSNHWVSLDRRGLPCSHAWTVNWTTDDGGHLTAIDGTYIPSCL